MRKGELERRIAVANTKHEIARRIRPVCEHFGDEEFDALVQRMAEIDVHFRLLDSTWGVHVEDGGADEAGSESVA